MRVSSFSEARLLIGAVEDHLVRSRASGIALWEWFRQLVWVPAKFLWSGVQEKLLGVLLWYVLWLFVFAPSCAFLLGVLGIESDAVALVIWFGAFLIPLLAVSFPAPTTYCDSGVMQESVEFVVRHLRERGFTRVEDVDLLRRSGQLFEDRCRARVGTLKWVMNLIWAAFAYDFVKARENLVSMDLKVLAAGIVWPMIAYLLVYGYAAALDRLFRAIEFGCNDFSHAAEAASVRQDVSVG